MITQNTESTVITDVNKDTLTSWQAYSSLKEPCEEVGHRQIGSEASIQAFSVLIRQLTQKIITLCVPRSVPLIKF